MSDSILCAIDFSDSSFRAMQWAIAEASQNHSQLHFLYPYRLQTGAQENAFQLKQKTEETAARKFADVENDLLVKKNIPYDFHTEVGFLEDRVTDRIAKNSVRMVVLPKEMCRSKESFDDLLKNVQIPIVIIS